jgi:inorganic pyrophosphatase
MFIAHPWHGIDHEFNGSEINGVIEISRGMKAKYEIDKKSGLLKLDRVLSTSFVYPINYGIFPKTLGEDGDPLDLLLLTQVEVEPLCLVYARPIGMLRMNDRGEGDDKIIAVLCTDPSVNEYNNIEDVPIFLKKEIQHFFQQYTVLEGKHVIVGEFYDREQALKVIQAAIERYSMTY